jgi:hypothetical protein
MALAAQLYRDDRGADRFRVDFDATLRDPESLPLDVVVEDLSASGFRVVTNVDLPVGVEVGLGLSGIGTHRARVIWHDRGAYGCELVMPLTSMELNTALSAPSSAPVTLPSAAMWVPPADEVHPVAQWSPRVRVLAITASAICAWAATIWLGVEGVSLL